jgi:hypothetical protein
MISFVMKDGRLQMTEQFMMIPQFVDIWERDKTERKEHANKLLFYVYLMADLSEDCPTKDLDHSMKDQECRFLAFKSKNYQFEDEDVEYVQAALDAYKKFNENAEERMLKTYDKKIDEVRHMLDETTPQISDGVNNSGVTVYTSNVDIINRALKEVSNLVKAKNDLRQAILAGKGAGHVRGNLILSPRDKKKIRPRK